MAGERLVRLMQQCGSRNPGCELVSGKVTSLKPLLIQLNDKIELDESFLILSPFCLKRQVDYPHVHTVSAIQSTSAGDPSHTHSVPQHSTVAATEPYADNFKVTLWPGIAVGDEVDMLAIDDGQLYYVLHKKGGL